MRQTLAAVLVGVATYVKASSYHIDTWTLALLTVSILATVSGATGLNMVLDADIDSVMERTRRRPIPSGRVGRREALVVSLVLTVIGLVLSLTLGLPVFLCGLAGVLIFDLLYTVLLKRRTPWSVVICSSAGAAPVLAGWLASGRGLSIEALVLSTIVPVWSILHIWTTATRWSEDYARARVPMLPVVYGWRTGVAGSLVVSIALLPLTVSLYTLHLVGPVVAIVLVALLVLASSLLYRALSGRDYERLSYRAFRIASIYLSLLFTLLLVPT